MCEFDREMYAHVLGRARHVGVMLREPGSASIVEEEPVSPITSFSWYWSDKQSVLLIREELKIKLYTGKALRDRWNAIFTAIRSTVCLDAWMEDLRIKWDELNRDWQEDYLVEVVDGDEQVTWHLRSLPDNASKLSKEMYAYLLTKAEYEQVHVHVVDAASPTNALDDDHIASIEHDMEEVWEDTIIHTDHSDGVPIDAPPQDEVGKQPLGVTLSLHSHGGDEEALAAAVSPNIHDDHGYHSSMPFSRQYPHATEDNSVDRERRRAEKRQRKREKQEREDKQRAMEMEKWKLELPLRELELKIQLAEAERRLLEAKKVV